jgi:integrase/recombinase XerD
VDDYERALAVACRMYPHTPIDGLTDIQLGQVFKRFPAKSRRVRVAPYRTFFKWARQTRRITENPMELLPTIKRTPRKQHDIFSDAEIDVLLGLPVIDAAPLGLLLEAGLRRREACEMTLRRCAPGSGAVKVVAGKGGKDRIVPTSARLDALLADLELLEGVAIDDHILYGVKANGQGARRVLRQSPIGEGTFARWWRRCLDTAGVRYRNPHEARHTFATRWRRRGLHADDLAIVMGHESVRTTIDLYFHIEPSEVAERMRLIEEAETV